MGSVGYTVTVIRAIIASLLAGGREPGGPAAARQVGTAERAPACDRLRPVASRTAWTASAVTRAQLTPRSTPATASESQWAARYVLDRAMARENRAAAVPQIARWRPVGTNAITSATAVTAAATAWPDGKDAALVVTRGWGGRVRS